MSAQCRAPIQRVPIDRSLDILAELLQFGAMLTRVGSSRREHLRLATPRKYHRIRVKIDQLLLDDYDEYQLDWSPAECGWCICCIPDWWGLSLPYGVEAPPRSIVDGASWVDQLASWLKSTNSLTTEFATWDDQLPGFEEARRQLDGVKSSAFQAWRNSHRAVAHCLLLLFPFWVRSPLDWRQDELLPAYSMGLHLLAHYPVPPALLSCFHAEKYSGPPGFWMVWILLYGQGASPLKAARSLGKPQLPARTYGLLLEAPRALTPEQALSWAEARRIGASERVAQLLVGNGWTLYSFDDVGHWTEILDQLRQVTSWLVRHIDQLDDRRAEVVLTWVRHRYSEAAAGHAPPFSLRRRTVESVVAHAEAYQEALVRAKELREALTWPGRGWDWSESTPTSTWSLRELCSARELVDEGIEMQHCVALYAERCAVGSIAIFSLSRDGERVATVEIAPHVRRVVQARGKNDRWCYESELEVIDRWLASLSLSGQAKGAVSV